MFSIPCQREPVYDSSAYIMVQSYPYFSPTKARSPIAQRYALEHPGELIAKVCAYSYLLDDQHSTISNNSTAPPSASQPDPVVITQDLPPPYEACVSSSRPKSQEVQMLKCRTKLRTPAADDISVEEKPSRHVDYLSHGWSEQDLRESWRYVRFHRDKYENSARLENAAWRAWAKLRDNLGTVSPVALNWLKESDDTFLYGPLRTSHIQEKPVKASPPASYCRSRKSCRSPKSILKKRTVSETILQQSPCPQVAGMSATPKVSPAERSRHPSRRPTQQPEPRPIIHKLYDLVKPAHGSQLATKTPASGTGLRSGKRRIRFNQEVLQCIAITNDGTEEGVEKQCLEFGDELSWDESYIVKLGGSKGGNKTIAPLPSTTLKHHGDAPDLQPSTATCWSWKRYIPMY